MGCYSGRKSIFLGASLSLALAFTLASCATGSGSHFPQGCEYASDAPKGFEIAQCIYPLSINMPVLIQKPPLRVATIPLQPANDSSGLPPDFYAEANTRVESYLQALRSTFPDMQIIERSQIDLALRELAFQAKGHVRDDNFVGVGRMLGADHLFLYQVSGSWDSDLEAMQKHGGFITGAASGKLIDVETGSIVFQQTIRQNLFVRKPDANRTWLHPLNKNKEWAAHMALKAIIVAIHEALLPSPVGISWVDDPRSGKVKVDMVFVNGPGHQAGIRRGDWITAVDGTPVRNGMDKVLEDMEMVPRSFVQITVERDGREHAFTVRPAQRHTSQAPTQPKMNRIYQGPPGRVTAPTETEKRPTWIWLGPQEDQLALEQRLKLDREKCLRRHGIGDPHNASPEQLQGVMECMLSKQWAAEPKPIP